jgi:hypothetical protein
VHRIYLAERAVSFVQQSFNSSAVPNFETSKICEAAWMDLRLRMSGVSDLLFQGTSPNLNNGRERSPHGPLIAALAGLELPFVCRCSSGLNGTATSRKQIEEKRLRCLRTAGLLAVLGRLAEVLELNQSKGCPRSAGTPRIGSSATPSPTWGAEPDRASVTMPTGGGSGRRCSPTRRSWRSRRSSGR